MTVLYTYKSIHIYGSTFTTKKVLLGVATAVVVVSMIVVGVVLGVVLSRQTGKDPSVIEDPEFSIIDFGTVFQVPSPFEITYPLMSILSAGKSLRLSLAVRRSCGKIFRFLL